MTTTGQLYWILLESDLTSADLYFPADTPLGHINPKRHYSLLKKRHLRQRERLIHLQVNELDEYQKTFSTEHKKDLNIKPTIAASEVVNGSEFLAAHSDTINEMLSTLSCDFTQNQDIAMSQDDDRDQRPKGSSRLKRKYEAGLEIINTAHKQQWETLSKIQASDLEVIPKEYQDPPVPTSSQQSKHRRSPASPPYRSGLGSLSPPNKRPMHYEDSRSHKRSKDDEEFRRRGDKSRHSSSKPRHEDKPSHSDKQQSPVKVPPPAAPVKKFTMSLIKKGHSKPPTVGTASNHGRPPVVGTADNNGRPPTVGTSNNSGRPPTVGTASNSGRPPVVTTADSHNRPPTVGTSNNNNGRPPVVGTANNNGRPPMVGTANAGNPNHRRDSTPLFGHKPVSHKMTSLLDRGTLAILKKPNRVMIRGPTGASTNYGDPKDYDDAINSSFERPDNPVYKRHTQGKDYLFYKTETGTVVTIGPVYKIQPAIHKFFLSM